MERHGLRLAPQKTEAVVMRGPYNSRDEIHIRVLGSRVQIKKELSYLGVVIDTRGYFGCHVVKTIEKAERRAAALTRFMPNIGGPASKKRLASWRVVQSTILYAAPIWCKALRIAKYPSLLGAIQRKMLLRVGYAYRTVSAQVIQVVTGIPPIDLLAMERARTWETGEDPQSKRETRMETVERWQSRWAENMESAQWTKRLIQHIHTWLACGHRRLSYWMTQFLTGHSSFRTFTKRIGKDRVDECRYCGHTGIPEYTIFYCQRWEGARVRKWGTYRGLLTTDNVVQQMMVGENEW